MATGERGGPNLLVRALRQSPKKRSSVSVHLDLSMRTAGILKGWSLTDYQSEYKQILQMWSRTPCH